MPIVTGNTYPVKDQLKALGGKWDPDSKGWNVPEKNFSVAVTLVEAAPKKITTLGKCQKCKGPVKEPYTLCYNCKFGVSKSYNKRRCDYCGSSSCSRAYNPHDLCDED